MLIDTHVHYGDWNSVKPLEEMYDAMLADMDANGVDRFVIAVTGGYDGQYGGFKLADALWFKRRQPERVFVLGGLDWSGLLNGGTEAVYPLTEQLDLLRAVGCDGLKLLNGKPDNRKILGHALDSETLEPIYQWLEANDWACVWHVADPPEFWNPDTTPLWARRNGWWYDETCPKKAQIDAEARRVFAKHPSVNFALAHFFFISQDLAAADALLTENPGLYLDLAPGVEMLHNFTANREQARAFFERWSERILYGTDVGMDAHNTHLKRSWMVRHFLETEDVFEVPDDPFMLPDDRHTLHGIGISAEARANIYSRNAIRLFGETPAPVDDAACRILCDRLIASAARRGATDAAAEKLKAELR
jgi:predicted TIM-barrel fold metal-dependent hydrolase